MFVGAPVALSLTLIFAVFDIFWSSSLLAALYGAVMRLTMICMASRIKCKGALVYLIVVFPLILAVEGLTLFNLVCGFFVATFVSNSRIQLKSTALLALLSPRFYGALQDLITHSIDLEQSWGNVALVIARAFMLGSGPPTMLAILSSVHDACVMIVILPIDITTTDEMDSLWTALIIAFLAARVLGILIFKYAIARMEFTPNYRDPAMRTPAAVIQYGAALFMYSPSVQSDPDMPPWFRIICFCGCLGLVARSVDLFMVVYFIFLLTIPMTDEFVFQVPDRPGKVFL